MANVSFIKKNSQNIMIETIVSLIPAVLYKTYITGWLGLFTLITLITTCLVSEIIFAKLSKSEIEIKDCSSVVSAILMFIAFNANMPVFVYIIAGIVCVIFGKMIYGGLGKNILTQRWLLGVLLWLVSLNL